MIRLEKELNTLNISAETKEKIRQVNYQILGYVDHDSSLAAEILESIKNLIDFEFSKTEVARILFTGLYMVPEKEEIMTLPQIKEETYKSESWLLRLLERGDLKGLRIDGEWLVKRSDFEKYNVRLMIGGLND